MTRPPTTGEQECRLTRTLTMSPLATRPTNASQPPEPAQALPLPDAHHRLLAPERQAGGPAGRHRRLRPGGPRPARGPFPCPRSHGDVVPAAPEHRKPRSRRSHDRANRALGRARLPS
ncbi:hypothetical protein FNV64_35420 [Streptomyces sp. S1A1-7]|nr:hypothetical protein FNV64_35420 [Streptomyces sp. S1A1-7]